MFAAPNEIYHGQYNSLRRSTFNGRYCLASSLGFPGYYFARKLGSLHGEELKIYVYQAVHTLLKMGRYYNTTIRHYWDMLVK